jgi:hypothetical protein
VSVRDWFLAPPDAVAATARPPTIAVARGIASAVVLGRPGEAEPLAAALALALRHNTGARAATVVAVRPAAPDPMNRAATAFSPTETLNPRPILGSAPDDDPARLSAAAGQRVAPDGGGTRGSEGADPRAPTGGTPAARKLAARLAAHGLDVTTRGRLAWVPVRADATAARRACAVGAPAVLAITAPLDRELVAVVAEQELAIVVTESDDGPLARLAVASLEALPLPVLTARPLPRGIARWAAHAGLAPPRSVRELAGTA